jgi:succinate dehydrogenase / fumarate reductase iron-sulfur subunit
MITFRIHRFTAGVDAEPRYQEFAFQPPEGSTVLDCINHIKWHLDDSLAYRMSCRSSICGSCSMRVNGKAKLVCKTQVSDVVRPDGTVTIDPMGNMPVIKDLIVDMRRFWEKMEAVHPFLRPDDRQPEPEKEYIQSPEDFHHYVEEATCIMCGACVSECTSLEFDGAFLGPAALAKAYRFAADTRDGTSEQRVADLQGHGGIWDCVRCNECVQVCPKTVAPMEAIVKLRQMAIQKGMTSTIGARHVTGFTDSVAQSGILDERILPLKVVGLDVGKMLEMAPVGLRMFQRGKLKLAPHHTVENVEDIRRIHRELEDGDK